MFISKEVVCCVCKQHNVQLNLVKMGRFLDSREQVVIVGTFLTAKQVLSTKLSRCSFEKTTAVFKQTAT